MPADLVIFTVGEPASAGKLSAAMPTRVAGATSASSSSSVSATADPPPIQVACQRPESLTYGCVIFRTLAACAATNAIRLAAEEDRSSGGKSPHAGR